MTFFDLILKILKWKKWIILHVFIVGLISSGISILLPKWYQAKTILAPPEEEPGLMGSLSQMVSSIPLTGLMGLGGVSDQLGLYLTILKSRTLREIIINKYNLDRVYKTPHIEETMKCLNRNVDFLLTDEGALQISVLDKQPIRAAEMANSFVHFLDSIFIQLQIHQARNARIFVEKRLAENRIDLENAESALMRFQQNYNMVALEEQTRITVSAAAELQAQIIASRFEMGMKSAAFGKNHTDVMRLESEIKSIEKEIERLQYGEFLVKDGMIIQKDSQKEIMIPLNKVPEIGQQYLRLYKELQIQNNLYIYLIQQYEQAKIQEIKDTPTIQVIDTAVPPIKKYKPKRMIIVISSVFTTTLLFLMFIVFYEKLSYMAQTDPKQHDKIQKLFSHIGIRLG